VHRKFYAHTPPPSVDEAPPCLAHLVELVQIHQQHRRAPLLVVRDVRVGVAALLRAMDKPHLEFAHRLFAVEVPGVLGLEHRHDRHDEVHLRVELVELDLEGLVVALLGPVLSDPLLVLADCLLACLLLLRPALRILAPLGRIAYFDLVRLVRG
jgi:hypothetical protein